MKLNERHWQLVGLVGTLFINLLFLSTRIELVGFKKVRSLVQSRKFIVAAWHGRLLLASYRFRSFNGIAMVSGSDDGEIIARVIQHQGHEAVRGSSTRGGLQALAEMIRRMKQGRLPAAIVPDGPLGPRYRVQPGIVILAQKTGIPILPVTYSGRRLTIFNSWDRFIFPFPFTTCRFIYGTPVHVPKDADSTGLENCRQQIEAELNRITKLADRYFGHCIT